MLVFWLISTLVFLPVSPEPTDLQLIADDFLTLARITNAIFLQSAAIRKDIKARDAIVELLKVAPRDFSEIVEVNAQLAFSTIKKLDTGFKSFSNANFGKDELERYAGGFLMLTPLLQEPPSETLDPNISSDDLINAISGMMKESSVFERKCSNAMLKSFTSINEMLPLVLDDDLKRRKRDNNAEEEKKALEALINFQNNFDSFVECSSSISDYSKQIEELPIWKIAGKHYITRNVVRFLWKDLPTMASRIPDFKLGLEISEIFLKDGKATGLLDSLISAFVKSLGAHKVHSDRLEPPLPVLTLSFLEPEELLKVFEDLKSPWFEKHFVRGASTEPLAKALQPFREISKKIQDLDAAWRPLNGLKITNNREGDMKHATLWFQYIEKLAQNRSSVYRYNDFVDELDTILQKCSVTPSMSFEKNFEKFELQLSTTDHLVTNLNSLYAIVKELKDHDYHTYFEDCFTKEKIIPEDLTTNSVNASEIISNLPEKLDECLEDSSEKDLKSLMEDFATLARRQSKLLTNVEEFKKDLAAPKKSGATLKEILKESKAIQIIDCFRTEKFNLKKFFETANFILGLHYFPKATAITDSMNFLDLINKIKTALAKVEIKIEEIGSRLKQSTVDAQNPVLLLNDSKSHSEDMGVCALALLNLAQVQQSRNQLLEINDFDRRLEVEMLKEGGLNEFIKAEVPIKRLLKQTDDVDRDAKALREKELLEMSEIFEKVSELRGVVGNREKLWMLNDRFKTYKVFPEEQKQLQVLVDLNLDFAMYHSRLKDGRHTVIVLKQYFDRIFGHVKDDDGSHKLIVEKHNSWLFIVLISIGIILLLAITGLIVYGCTSKGREKFTILYLFYFGKPQDFEKRWRYSYFADKVDGKNALLDAVREISKTNLLVALKKGAYINAYNFYGNTALHAATKAAHPEFVELLIKYGADRTLLNTQNRTPEQMIPFNYGEKEKEKAVKYDQIKQIFKKYRNKKFRIHVPVIFPVSSYHIFIEENTDNKITNQFLDTFPSITSIEPNLNSTHCIVPTDENGILVADNINLLFWIFNGTIIVKEKWMIDCIQNEMIIEQDFKYLVENVKFKGVVYDTIIQWTNSMAKYEIPYLHGVLVIVVMKEYFNLYALNVIVTAQGGTLLTKFPKKKNLNIGACPYLHANLGPIFIIHDGLSDLSRYKNDKMYTLFTEDEFIIFLLERKINRDTSENPIFVTKPEDEIDRSEVEDGNE